MRRSVIVALVVGAVAGSLVVMRFNGAPNGLGGFALTQFPPFSFEDAVTIGFVAGTLVFLVVLLLLRVFAWPSSTSGPEPPSGWRCPNCSEANGAAIDRCTNCSAWRPSDGDSTDEK